jgi:hypothetical protein
MAKRIGAYSATRAVCCLLSGIPNASLLLASGLSEMLECYQLEIQIL